jgi:glycosyltransferase involved in cell wall biosynthesis
MTGSHFGPAVSVVVPFYSGLEYLERTIAGLSRQTLDVDQWELIVAEDGAVERTDRVLRKYPRMQIRRVSIPRKGFRLASVRNAAVLAAAGPLIVMLDFDCVPLPDHLEKHVSLLRAESATATVGIRRFTDLSHVPAGEIVRGEWWEHAVDIPSISNRGQSIDKRVGEIEQIAEHRCPSNLFHGCNVGFWRESAIDVGLFSEAFNGSHGYEDIQFAWRLQTAGVAFRYVDTPVFHQENAVVSSHDRAVGRLRNYSILAELVPELVEFRQREAR